jgi:lysophospholipase L1-like esterase
MRFLGRLAQVACSAFVLFSLTACTEGTFLSQPVIRDADNDNVVFLGDSIFALSGEIQTNLHARAGGTFRNYTTSGAELSGGLIQPAVAQQYANAFADNPNSRVVVMNGGGNDILIPVVIGDPFDCLTGLFEFGRLSRTCQSFVNDVRVEATDLLNQMAANGTSDVLYLGYYYTKNGLLGRLDSLEQAVDFGDAQLALACQSSVVRCTFIDPRRAIVDGDIVVDGVHPNASGSRKLADLIWPLLAPKL